MDDEISVSSTNQFAVAPTAAISFTQKARARLSSLPVGYETLTAGLIVLAAILAIADSFKSAGWTATGPGAGWYPLWSAVAMGLAAAIVLVRSLRAKATRRLFSSSEGLKAFWQLAIPMVVGVSLLSWFGFYLVSGAYMGLFARWIGRYRWIWVAVLTVVVPLSLYLTFEQGFKVPLPKSLFYQQGIMPF